MNIIKTKIPEVLVLEPEVFGDDRGFFLESYNQKTFEQLGLRKNFVQDNHSRSARNVLRGLHYQLGQPQGKLVRVVSGAIWDVAVDLRRSSPTCGQWVAEELSAENKRIFWIPEGFAHGFLVISDSADVLYKATDFYAPSCERSLLWNDSQLGISWPLSGEPLLSKKDRAGVPFSQAELFE
ncbi:MAG: dTDP-4-dehydrorhamnose 3,5-epimerase [Acidobacteria bacterium]|nr:MAG: dTDP-4-dehydrorhamnose 3,5-epimerase [Acidobacteriota bacterium]